MITPILTLALGGALGAVARYHTTRLIARIHPSARFPFATFLINLTGSALLGALLGSMLQTSTDLTQSPLYLLLGTGFCGAFTTFSTFTVETHALLHPTNHAQPQKTPAARHKSTNARLPERRPPIGPSSERQRSDRRFRTAAHKKSAAAAYLILTITGCLALFILCFSIAALFRQ